ncbi:Hypothetical protein CAP_8081 [Chondromyces apiculatus DSM 436]|uniref:MalT-like TPR region domain-containing protein n=1 Tax=Chondromyces apiculatus DSM 436 TaxID=1192034 RepID=A0A017SY44_9BACT|nr:Hypothetical protein CAP_8081 [Chondromyces apiculatus DSM 436]
MTEAARQLLREDEQQIQALLAALRHGGRFVILVADETTWPEAKKLLEHELCPPPLHEVPLATGEEVMRMFASPEATRAGTLVLHVGSDAAAAIAALNLHRDKLRKQRGRFVLRLDGPHVHRQFAHEAPDGYSFRDALAIVDGRAAVEVVRRVPARVSQIQEALKEEKGDAEQLLQLATELFKLAHLGEARRALDRGIALLRAKKHLSPEDLVVLAMSLHLSATFLTPEEQPRRLRDALHVLEPVRDRVEDIYGTILGDLRDGRNSDIDAVREALALAVEYRDDTPQAQRQRLNLAFTLWYREDIQGASAELAQVASRPWASTVNRFRGRLLEAEILLSKGHWTESEQHLRAMLIASAADDLKDVTSMLMLRLASLTFWRGELEQALETLSPSFISDVDPLRMRIRCSRGDAEAIASLMEPLGPWHHAPSHEHERNRIRAKIDAIRAAVEAGLLDGRRGEQLDAELEALAAQVSEVAPEDPPWSRIHAALLFADDFLGRSGAEDRARAEAEGALTLARRGAPELIPPCVHRLGVAALRLGTVDELPSLFEEALSAAEERHLPGDAARIRGLDLWRIIQVGGDVASAERALDASIARTGSVLVEAEVLSRTGRGTGRRDLLERSRRIYRALPWPEREGLCLEAMGMKTHALKRYEAAGLRLAALALERRTAPPPVDACFTPLPSGASL